MHKSMQEWKKGLAGVRDMTAIVSQRASPDIVHCMPLARRGPSLTQKALRF